MKPFVISAAMALMMLWMLHMQLTGGSNLGGWAAVTFVGAHLLVALATLALTRFAARLPPALRNRLSRLHRPSLRHVSLMVAGMSLAGDSAHLALHGGMV